ncbi:MAG: hypothetical protein QOG64_1928, partial [Acidimicrobiaceae bacterium]|nr:hypothetical protein [Acidimicrobiaceae bacterium]
GAMVALVGIGVDTMITSDVAAAVAALRP